MSNTDAFFLRDLVGLIVAKAKAAKQARDTTNSEYEIGQLMAFHDVVSLIQQQAEAFSLDFEDIGMANINPDIDLL